MRTVERPWRISLAAALLTTVWTATTLAAEPLNTAATLPSRPATATPSKPVPTRMGLPKPASYSFLDSLRLHFPLILGVAY
jgi:hypothetical protein